MDAKTLRRISAELKEIEKQKESLEKDGIFIRFNEENITVLKVLIHFEDLTTPYSYGYYMFLFTFPDDYPFSPPKVSFMTHDYEQTSVRLHPNYYQNGKVCLSSINTWASNDWSPSRTCLGEIINIRSRLDSSPIKYEPSYENANNEIVKNYNNQVLYGNFQCAVIKMITSIPREFVEFIPFIKQQFIKNYEKIMELVDKQVDAVYTYYKTTVTNYQSIKTELKKIYDSIQT